jgi:hypothetical protein
MRKRHFYHTPADRIIDIIASVYDGNGNWIRDLEELSRGMWSSSGSLREFVAVESCDMRKGFSGTTRA